jgi:tape measure domain-containing protein
MSEAVRTISTVLKVKKDGHAAALRSAASDLDRFKGKVSSTGAAIKADSAGWFSGLGGVVTKLGAVGAALGVVAGAGAVLTKGFTLAAEAEAASVKLEVLTKSAAEATRISKELRTLGAKTPYETADLMEATVTLKNFGITNQAVVGSVEQLSNVAGGNADKLKSLALVYGQVAANQKLQGGDLLQFINAGWNPLNEVIKRTGESMTQVRDRMSKGKLSFEEIQQALQDATTGAGAFAGMNDKMSQTAMGRWSSMQDAINEVLRTVGERIAGMLGMNDLITGIADAAMAAIPSVNKFFDVMQEGFNIIKPLGEAAFFVFKSTFGAMYDIIADVSKTIDSLFDRLHGLKTQANGGLTVEKNNFIQTPGWDAKKLKIEDILPKAAVNNKKPEIKLDIKPKPIRHQEWVNIEKDKKKAEEKPKREQDAGLAGLAVYGTQEAHAALARQYMNVGKKNDPADDAKKTAKATTDSADLLERSYRLQKKQYDNSRGVVILTTIG